MILFCLQNNNAISVMKSSRRLQTQNKGGKLLQKHSKVHTWILLFVFRSFYVSKSRYLESTSKAGIISGFLKEPEALDATLQRINWTWSIIYKQICLLMFVLRTLKAVYFATENSQSFGGYNCVRRHELEILYSIVDKVYSYRMLFLVSHKTIFLARILDVYNLQFVHGLNVCHIWSDLLLRI